MKFLIDRCAGHRLAIALRQHGHDVVEATQFGPDPGDRSLLELAHRDQRVLVTMLFSTWLSALRHRRPRSAKSQRIRATTGDNRLTSGLH